ncbi:lipopolysaccharide biosynthesis protein [Sinomicrobium weinanense]|uniref:Oligosaccharide flippase family protein n=1 Tax=Sinomicrobium weinanense TaxID=2842200 RepID=A0A926Q2S0_9FLAO|nr:oligosaccharide flippase family protein [Sinomicrobium weinanense]MBC9796927.1 oligosaccharide flippase family protein [Sinomicrobium weinanense]MBU3124235.1 oligosaccharide flippase family protein [Sinomicrobium weinanense]
MGALQKLFKHTFIYGLATVLPRMLTFLLVPLYTDILPKEEYGEVSILYSWIAIFNVVLAYGMETAFFRFYNLEADKQKVVNTSSLSLVVTTLLFLFLFLPFREPLAVLSNVDTKFIVYTVWILALDALAIIPFARLRATERPLAYTYIKMGNVAVNFGLNFFFLIFLPRLADGATGNVWNLLYIDDFEIAYIFISNLVASALTFLVVLPMYRKVKWRFDRELWVKMMRYAWPVLIAGLAYTVNEVFDRLLLDYLLPKDIAKGEVGAYSACRKIATFMMLYATAFRLGVEPFFFSYAKNKNAPETYALVTQYFVIFGSCILLGVMAFITPLKSLIIRDESYWEALGVVPMIILGNLCLGIYHNLSVWYKVTDKTRYGAYISVFGALVTLVLNFALIPLISYKGSAIAVLAAYGSMMLISYILGQKHYPVPYNLKKIGAYLSVSVLFSLLSFYVFKSDIVVGSGLLLVFLTLVFYLERKELKRIFLDRYRPGR